MPVSRPDLSLSSRWRAVPLWAAAAFACAPVTTAPNVRISELMGANTRTLTDDQGRLSDWIEIINPTNERVSLQDWGLSDTDTNPFKWVFPYRVLAPGERIVVFASNQDRTDPSQSLHTNFRLRASGEPLLLTANDGRLIDRVRPVSLPPDISWGRTEANTATPISGFFLVPTPGEPNTEAIYESLDALAPATVRINEIAMAGAQGLVDRDGHANDWIEIFNPGTAPVQLDGYALTDDLRDPALWRFPPVRLDPGAYMVIFASGKDRTQPSTPKPSEGSHRLELHTNFRIHPGERVGLMSPSGDPLDIVSTERSPEFGSLGRNEGYWVGYAVPTPGAENTTEPGPSIPSGSEKSTLRINEAMPQSANNPLGVDWIELQNVSDAPIELGGTGLSDDPKRPYLGVLPEGSLPPGGFAVYRLTGSDCAPPECPSIQLPFRLSSNGEELILTGADQTILDTMVMGPLDAGISVGLRPDGQPGPVLFSQPTPGAPNASRWNDGRANTPRIEGTDLFVEDGSHITIHTAAPGEVIRYTTDGASPNANSRVYKVPIEVTRGITLRARAYAAGKLASSVATRHVLPLDESESPPHDIPITALGIDPHHLFNEKYGLLTMGNHAKPDFPHKGANFWSNRTLNAHFAYFSQEGRLKYADDIGFRVFGQWSRALPKKGFKLVARPQYGAALFHYPFFGEAGTDPTDDLVLRASGQDSRWTGFRDVLVTELVEGLEVDFAPAKATVLYVNGEYWGFYNLREHLDEDLLAVRAGVAYDQIILLHSTAKQNIQFSPVRQLMAAQISTDEGALEEMEKLVDLDSFIDWTAVTVYTGNIDYGNCRYWKTRAPEGRWRWLLFDLDLSMMSGKTNIVKQLMEPSPGWRVQENRNLYQWLKPNPEFRARFLARTSYVYREIFPPNRVSAAIDRYLATYSEELTEDRKRWEMSPEDWHNHVKALKKWPGQRPAHFRLQMQDHFGLTPSEMDRFFPVWENL